MSAVSGSPPSAALQSPRASTQMPNEVSGTVVEYKPIKMELSQWQEPGEVEPAAAHRRSASAETTPTEVIPGAVSPSIIHLKHPQTYHDGEDGDGPTPSYLDERKRRRNTVRGSSPLARTSSGTPAKMVV